MSMEAVTRTWFFEGRYPNKEYPTRCCEFFCKYCSPDREPCNDVQLHLPLPEVEYANQ